MGLSCLIDFRETAVVIVAPLIGIVVGLRIEDAIAIASASPVFAER
jgi:hypothetical protein